MTSRSTWALKLKRSLNWMVLTWVHHCNFICAMFSQALQRATGTIEGPLLLYRLYRDSNIFTYHQGTQQFTTVTRYLPARAGYSTLLPGPSLFPAGRKKTCELSRKAKVMAPSFPPKRSSCVSSVAPMAPNENEWMLSTYSYTFLVSRPASFCQFVIN